MGSTLKKVQDKQRRQLRGRQRIIGTPQRPRLHVYRSLKHIYAQVIDDVSGRVLASVSSLSPDLKTMQKYGGNVACAKMVGAAIAEKAKAVSITRVVFDRAGRRFHGRVKALAEAAREAGLEF